VALILAACGKESTDASPISKRPLKPAHREVVTRFADAVAKKDYRAAFEETAADFKSQVGWEEFEKSIRRYRDQAETAPAYVLGATEDDPKDFKEGLIELFVPEAERGRVVEEAVIRFTVKGKTPDDAGFWAVILWIVDDGASAKILNYVQDD
jgi:hypothetical protein